MPDITPFSPVLLFWEDAFHDTTAQYDNVEAALREYDPKIRKTVGYYIGQTEKNGRRCVVISTDDDREGVDDEHLGGPFYCPVGLIIKIELLHRKKPRKKRGTK